MTQGVGAAGGVPEQPRAKISKRNSLAALAEKVLKVRGEPSGIITQRYQILKKENYKVDKNNVDQINRLYLRHKGNFLWGGKETYKGFEQLFHRHVQGLSESEALQFMADKVDALDIEIAFIRDLLKKEGIDLKGNERKIALEMERLYQSKEKKPSCSFKVGECQYELKAIKSRDRSVTYDLIQKAPDEVKGSFKIRHWGFRFVKDGEKVAALEVYSDADLIEPEIALHKELMDPHGDIPPAPHLIPFYGESKVEDSEDETLVVMDLDDDEEVRTLVFQAAASDLYEWSEKGDPALIYRAGKNMIQFLSNLHQRGIIYRDVKDENLLVIPKKDGGIPDIKITDLGLARKMDERGIVPGLGGTDQHLAPEMYYDLESVAASDTYSLGSMLFCLRYDQFWQEEESQETHVIPFCQTRDEIEARYKKIAQKDELDDFDRLVIRCLSFYPYSRPSDAEFEKEWDRIEAQRAPIEAKRPLIIEEIRRKDRLRLYSSAVNGPSHIYLTRQLLVGLPKDALFRVADVNGITEKDKDKVIEALVQRGINNELYRRLFIVG